MTTTTPAGVDQQLRAHLATLKLTAAAEHLPTVLDQAVAENLTTTATLERLLAIEVTHTENRRLASRLQLAGLPSPASLDTFDFDAAPGADPALSPPRPTSCSSAHPGSGKPTSRPPWPAKPPKPDTAPTTSPPPRTSPPAAGRGR